MDREVILKQLSSMRKLQYSLWEDYCVAVFDWQRELRDDYDMNCRVLDYLMEAIKKHDTV